MLKVANAPCSWGVIENTPGERGGYALVLDEMQETGYIGTELGDWGFMPTDPDQLRAGLDARGLELLASWVSVRLYDSDYHDVGTEEAVRTAHLLREVGGPECLIVIGDDHSTVPERHDNAGRIKPEHGLSGEGWEIYTAGASQVAEVVKRETGLRSVIHHHGATYIETSQEVTKFLSVTDPDLIGLCFDTGHYALGGGDPVEGIRQHADRIWHVHFKDFDPSVVARADDEGWGYQQMIGQGVFSELGQGNVDFPAVLSALREIDYDGWVVVEQDVLPGMGSPKDSAARNRQYLHSIGI
jgi:inosose dehydratase